VLAEARYASWAARLLIRPLVLFVVVVVIGALVEHEFGPGHPWSQAFFISYTLNH
jgi:hypothetical protein